MKTLYKLAFSFFLLCSFAFVSADEIIAAIKNGDSAQVSKYFDDTVQITLPDKSNSYSKSQAELVLRDFFANNVIRNFEVLHKGDNAGSQFYIGTLQTRNGNFRTTIYLKQKGDKQVLQELRFEK